jgi:hypothetical protein
MKIRLTLINLSLILYVIGLLLTVGIGMKLGAVIVQIASAIILIVFIHQIILSIRLNNLWSFHNLLYTLAILVLAVIFIHGFSVSIGMPFLGNIPLFSSLFLVTGIVLTTLFLTSSILIVTKLNDKRKQRLLISVFSIASLVLALGLLGIAGIIPFFGWLTIYGLMFLTLFYPIFFVILVLVGSKENKAENLILLLLSAAMILFLVLRVYFPQLLPSSGLTNSMIILGFVPVIILPLSIFCNKKFHFFTVFILYFIVLDLYFIHTDRNLKYLINVGVNGCVGYEDATAYPINSDPGISIDKLLKEPTENELNNILREWKEKDFTSSQLQIEFVEVRPNGDSIKVVSHLINGRKHYGVIRIPKNIDVSTAPILLGLMGGGTGIDVLKTSDINRLSSGKCHQLLDNYISIMPTFRGNIVRGEDFCFRSEGYSGDVWLGAAEDAVAFLEVVKFMYNKNGNTKILASGVSRGATVALIIGGLTNKLDYIIANSTHTKFLDRNVVFNERVGGSYPSAFYTPKTTPGDIRKRIIASSPYYFLNNLPAFEVHQGTEDQQTTVWHARMLEIRLNEIDRLDMTSHIYIHEGQGHAYEDDDIVCASLGRFLQLEKTNPQ